MVLKGFRPGSPVETNLHFKEQSVRWINQRASALNCAKNIKQLKPTSQARTFSALLALQEAVVMPHQKMRFHLSHGVQHHAD